ncbi:MAG: glycine zipper 2TM domain-containing protein [bacterium]
MSLPRRIFVLVATAAFAAGCREKAPVPADSALAQDLAMAQRAGAAGPSVFNDAPIGTAPASKAKGAPTPRPEPPRASAPTPRPTPRRQQPPAPVSRTPQPMPQQPVTVAQVPAPTPAPAAGVIGSGSRIGMNTNAKVCTASLLIGDKFTATVSNGAVGSNGAAIPAGATVVLEVAAVDRSDPIESSRVTFRVRSIDVNGESLPVTGDVAVLAAMDKVQSSSNNDRQKVIGGAVAGAVLGRIFGKSTKATVIGAAAGAAAGTVAAKNSQTNEACLPEGSPLRLTITRDIVMRSAI